jgi:hypothetical protein
LKRLFLVIVVLAVIAARVWALFCTKRTSEPFKGYEAAEQFVTIEPGSGTRSHRPTPDSSRRHPR